MTPHEQIEYFTNILKQIEKQSIIHAMDAREFKAAQLKYTMAAFMAMEKQLKLTIRMLENRHKINNK